MTVVRTTTGSLDDARVVLVGGAGFIGHSLAVALRRRGARVDVVDSLQVNNLASFAGVDGAHPERELALRAIHERLELLGRAGARLHVLDARDHEALATLLRRLEPTVLVHLAGIAHAERSNRDPHAAFEHTLRTLQHSLDAGRDHLEHVVYFSSSMVYGDFASAAVDEDAPCAPIGVYGALKYAGEKIVIAHEQVFGVPYTIVRPSALYGERCVSRRVVQIFIEHALRGEPLPVAGDGSARLDFTYIDDLVGGVVQIIRTPAARNEIFNVTYGRSRSIAELVELLRGHVPGVEVARRPPPRLAPKRGTLSIDKARRLIGYAPAFPLETGLERYVEWCRGRLAPAPASPPEVAAAVPAGA